MKYEFFDELETIATYPLTLLSDQERGEFLLRGERDPISLLSEETKKKIAHQINLFMDENRQFLSESIHQVRIIESLNKLRNRCDSIGIPWEKGHIIKTMKEVIGKIKSDDPLFTNLPNNLLLPFLLICADGVADLKKISHENQRVFSIMTDPSAISNLCEKPIHEWGIDSGIAVDFLAEYATHVPNLQLDFSFCRDLDDEHLIKLAKSCSNITSINLSGCTGISNTGIESFTTNNHLRHLYCFDCPKISVEETKRIREILPNCSIFG